MLEAALRLPLSVLSFVLGTLVGSFLNVVIARLPRGESIVHPRSHCPKCGDMIPAWLNVPILSWLALRGRCRACKSSISIRYPMVELLTGVLFWACFTRFGLTWGLLAGFIFAGSMVAITFIDIDTFEIADEISLPGIVIGIFLRPLAFAAPWWSGLAGAVLGGGFLWLVRIVWSTYMGLRIRLAKGQPKEVLEELESKREGMGFGDVKLIAMIGAFLGPPSLLPVVMVASVVGTIIGGALLLHQHFFPAPAPTPEELAALEADREARKKAALAKGEEPDDWEPAATAVPFGPFLAIGALTWMLVGPALERWFFQALGLVPP